jgi:hypothetical protein
LFLQLPELKRRPRKLRRSLPQIRLLQKKWPLKSRQPKRRPLKVRETVVLATVRGVVLNSASFFHRSAKAAEAVAAEKAAADAKAKAAVATAKAETPAAAPAEAAPSATGGRVLPKEEVSAETLALIKSLKK